MENLLTDIFPRHHPSCLETVRLRKRQCGCNPESLRPGKETARRLRPVVPRRPRGAISGRGTRRCRCWRHEQAARSPQYTPERHARPTHHRRRRRQTSATPCTTCRWKGTCSRRSRRYTVSTSSRAPTGRRRRRRRRRRPHPARCDSLTIEMQRAGDAQKMRQHKIDVQRGRPQF